jgi:hypothetical protein
MWDTFLRDIYLWKTVGSGKKKKKDQNHGASGLKKKKQDQKHGASGL